MALLPCMHIHQHCMWDVTAIYMDCLLPEFDEFSGTKTTEEGRAKFSLTLADGRVKQTSTELPSSAT